MHFIFDNKKQSVLGCAVQHIRVGRSQALVQAMLHS